MQKIIIYTDGGCRPNPGRGAYAYVVLDEAENILHEHSLSEPETTNNIMELSATIAALNWVHTHYPGVPVVIYVDSQYVQLGITDWIHGWKRRGWKSSTGKPVKNQDLWYLLDSVTDHMPHLTFEWVRGHDTSKWNNYVDALCGKHF